MSRLPGLLSLTALLIFSTPAINIAFASETVSITLNAQSLSNALQEFSRQTGRDVLFSNTDVAPFRAPAISGRLQASEILHRLLAHTGLSATLQDDGSVTISRGRAVKAHKSTAVIHHNGEMLPASESVTVLGRAQPLAPSTVPLDITEPKSVIQSKFIANNIVPLASIDDIIKFQPSVWSQNPNGPGIGKAETISLRGFQDGQYNMTFDGIPFGDASDLHHTTSSLFIAHDLGQVDVDRGPGTAATVGNATFGGTMGFQSKDPAKTFGATAYGTYGSFDTKAGGFEVDSGKTRFGKMFLDLQHEETDGYLSHSNERRTNIMFKDEIDLGANTTMTVASSYNKEWQYTTQGATLAEYAKYGDNYGLCDDPAKQCDYRYNPSAYQSDFSYIAIKSQPLSWLSVENRIYTWGFEHDYTESTDASQTDTADNGTTFYSAAGKKIATYASDIPGKYADAKFRDYGDRLDFKARTPYGELLTGIWADVQEDRRYSEAVDLTKNAIPVPGKTGTAYSYNIQDTNTTIQPYLEYDIHPFKGMTIKPGIKYSYFYRKYDASLNKSTKEPLYDNNTYSSWQPSVAINQRLTKGWSIYGQVARGFLAPPLSVFQVADVGNVKPETTWNYQIGTGLKHRRWTVSADAYYIDFSNYIASAQTKVPGIGTESTYVNSGGAIYKGLEIEGQYALGHGFSLYGNYSVNSAQYKHTGVRVAETPNALASFGLLYENPKGPYFSIIGKYVGHRWGLDSTTDGNGDTVFQNQYRIGSNVTADLAMGWHFHHVGGFVSDITPSLKIANLFDNRSISDFAGNQSASSANYPDGAPLYWRLAGRSLFFNMSMTVP